MAISRLISSIYEALSPSAVALVFVTAATPPQRTHGVSLLTRLLQLDYIFTPMEPCWISVVVHSPALHLSGRGHFVSLSDIFADMFHLVTDVNAKEVQMEISAF